MTRRIASLPPLATLVLLAACTGPGTSLLPTTGTSSPAAEPTAVATPSEPTQLKVGLGYIPSVQFAPFYLAEQRGYYRDAGLAVTFENKIDPDLVTLVGQGALDVGLADGTSVIPAVSQGIPIRYLATVYGTYPSVVFAKEGDIETAADLEGKRIGIPGRFGSSWIMLQALLQSVDLTPEDVTIVEYPDFGQWVAVMENAVAAATGFVNNEPVLLELAEGNDVVVLQIDDVVALPGPGLIAGTGTIATKGAAISAFRDVTLRAMREIAADPEAGLEAAFTAVPELADEHGYQDIILERTIAAWAAPGSGPAEYGTLNRAGWQASIEFMMGLGLVPNPVTVDDLLWEAGTPPPVQG